MRRPKKKRYLPVRHHLHTLKKAEGLEPKENSRFFETRFQEPLQKQPVDFNKGLKAPFRVVFSCIRVLKVRLVTPTEEREKGSSRCSSNMQSNIALDKFKYLTDKILLVIAQW